MVVSNDDDLYGFVTFRIEAAGGQHVAFVYQLAVDVALRSTSMGAQILSRLSALAASMGLAGLALQVAHANRRARRFYARPGFIKAGCILADDDFEALWRLFDPAAAAVSERVYASLLHCGCTPEQAAHRMDLACPIG